MKLLRIASVLLFTAALVLFIFFKLNTQRDSTVPVLNCDTQLIEVKVDYSEEELLSHLSASDEKDGDLSDKIVVEGITPFIKKGVSRVSFAVCDSDKNVARKTVDIKFTDYHSPRFTSSSPLIFSESATVVRFLNFVSAEDMFDGSLDGRAMVVRSEFVSAQAGVYPVTFRVSNLKGDVVELTLNAVVREHRLDSAVEITLDNYIHYVKLGETPDYISFVKKIGLSAALVRQGLVYGVDDVVVDTSELVPDKEGIYDIWYRIFDEEGNEIGSTRLFLVCEK